jgi:hypothetical protein
VVKIKEQIAEKILNEEQLQIWHNEDYGLILETAGSSSDGFFLKDGVKIGIYFSDQATANKVKIITIFSKEKNYCKDSRSE